MKKTIITACIFLIEITVSAQNPVVKITQDTNLFAYIEILLDSNRVLKTFTPSNAKEIKKLEEGEVYYKNGDTIPGYIEILTKVSDDNNLTAKTLQTLGYFQALFPIKIIFYKKSNPGKGLKIRADKILGFKKGNRFYVSKKTEEYPSFYIEKIVCGSINLYMFRYHYEEPYSNYGFSETKYRIDYYIDKEANIIKEFGCADIRSFLDANFSTYPGFIETMNKKIRDLSKNTTINKLNPYDCEYLIEIVQLKNMIDVYKTSVIKQYR